MVQIVGKYQHVSNENFEEFMKALGHPELVIPFLQSKAVVEVQRNADQWTITVTSDGKSSAATFKVNEPYEEKLPSSDRKFQSVTTQEGNNFITETQLGDTLKVVRLYEFTDTEMKVVSTFLIHSIALTRKSLKLNFIVQPYVQKMTFSFAYMGTSWYSTMQRLLTNLSN
ncbi:Fatty acid-binding protein, liver [Habropoda laboriosa]|uniref:Fatty acid-binding protein, liver n=1 Tax=Habropoda laboriosa TaxID=597456 RepID=A0A0L7R164_9HYME|nr:Fatty acid-binding protein, liver [Habropoda laboriosa]